MISMSLIAMEREHLERLMQPPQQPGGSRHERRWSLAVVGASIAAGLALALLVAL